MPNSVWVFSGTGGPFPAGVFLDKEAAVAWIESSKLSGVLTEYPLNVGVFDWANERGLFTPKNEAQRSPDFIQRFTSYAQVHFHFEDGIEGGDSE